MDRLRLENRLFSSCRRGDLDKVRSMVETKDVDLNIRDKWDSTPLYYACLCGHEELVQYLLTNGARCEANTFDGERCFYAALSQRIKDMLMDFKAVTSTCFRRDLFSEYLRQCLETPHYFDISFCIHGVEIKSHRIILLARCPYMKDMFETRWKGKYQITLNHSMMHQGTFRCLLQYLYTGRVDIHLQDVDMFLLLCKQCKMDDLALKVKDAFEKFHGYADLKPKALQDRISVIGVEPPPNSNEVGDSFADIVYQILPQPVKDQQFPFYWLYHIQPSMTNESNDVTSEIDPYSFQENHLLYADVCFIVKETEFYCHQVFMSGRSEYLKAVIHFHQTVNGKVENDIIRIKLNDLTAEIFGAIVNFIYTDRCEISSSMVFDLLYASDLFLLPGLKRQCSRNLSENLTSSSVLTILRLARLYNLDRLELSCCEFIAGNLEKVVFQDCFEELVREDALAVQDRQETDSINIIDDIRFQIHRSVLPGIQKGENSSSLPADEKLRLLDDVLLSFGVDI